MLGGGDAVDVAGEMEIVGEGPAFDLELDEGAGAEVVEGAEDGAEDDLVGAGDEGEGEAEGHGLVADDAFAARDGAVVVDGEIAGLGEVDGADELEAGEALDGDGRRAEAFGGGGGDEEGLGDLAEGAALPGGLSGGGAEGEGEVEVTGRELGAHLRGGELEDADAEVELGLDHVRQDGGGQPARRSDGEDAPLERGAGGELPGEREHLLEVRDDAQAGVEERDAVRAAREQGGAHQLLEPRDGLRDLGGSDAQLASGGGQAAAAMDGQEGDDVRDLELAEQPGRDRHAGRRPRLRGGRNRARSQRLTPPRCRGPAPCS